MVVHPINIFFYSDIKIQTDQNSDFRHACGATSWGTFVKFYYLVWVAFVHHL
jgi:hypothetical protein